MAKITAVIEKEYTKDGQAKKLFNCQLEQNGKTLGATAFDPVKVGDEIADDRIGPGKNGDLVIRSANKGGSGKKPYYKNDEIIVSQCAVKIVAELVLGGALGPDVLKTEKALTDTALPIAKAIVNVSKQITVIPKLESCEAKTTAPAAKPKDELEEHFGPKAKIKGSKELFQKLDKDLQLKPAELVKVRGFTEAVNRQDYDKAWQIAYASTGAPQ